MEYSIDFMPVGNSNGDAIVMRYGYAGTTHQTDIIDGGYTEVGKGIVLHLLRYFPDANIQNMLLTHADDDHARGLIPILEQCSVGALYMNRPWLYVDEVIEHFHGGYTRQGLIDRFKDMHPYLVQLEEIAQRKGTLIFDALQGTRVGCSTILAPSRARYVQLIPDFDKTPTSYRDANPFAPVVETVRNALDTVREYWGTETLQENPDPTSASNEASVVQLAQLGSFHALFTGDAGPQAMHEAADFAQRLGILRPPDLFQVPHQGSRRNVTPSVLDRWLGPMLPHDTGQYVGRAACSVGANKTSHPRKKVSNALLRRGYPTSLARTAPLYLYSDSYDRGWPAAATLPFYSDVTETDA